MVCIVSAIISHIVPWNTGVFFGGSLCCVCCTTAEELRKPLVTWVVRLPRVEPGSSGLATAVHHGYRRAVSGEGAGPSLRLSLVLVGGGHCVGNRIVCVPRSGQCRI